MWAEHMSNAGRVPPSPTWSSRSISSRLRMYWKPCSRIARTVRSSWLYVGVYVASRPPARSFRAGTSVREHLQGSGTSRRIASKGPAPRPSETTSCRWNRTRPASPALATFWRATSRKSSRRSNESTCSRIPHRAASTVVSAPLPLPGFGDPGPWGPTPAKLAGVHGVLRGGRPARRDGGAQGSPERTAVGRPACSPQPRRVPCTAWPIVPERSTTPRPGISACSRTRSLDQDVDSSRPREGRRPLLPAARLRPHETFLRGGRERPPSRVRPPVRGGLTSPGDLALTVFRVLEPLGILLPPLPAAR